MADWPLRCTLLALADEPSRSHGRAAAAREPDDVIWSHTHWRVLLAGREYAAGTQTQDRRIMSPLVPVPGHPG